jgi:pimeloyl-ACP methyl ester carboxylesterase
VPEPPVPVAAAADRSAQPAADGAPVLVLGNSLGTSSAVWAAQAGEFAPHLRVIGYELPGHGGTPAAPGDYTLAGLGAGVLALADSLGVEHFAYCGISLGGMIGMWLAANAPDRVTALGLVCTSAFLPPAGGWHDRAAKVRAGGMAAVSEAVIARWFTPAFAAASPAAVAACQADLERTGPAGTTFVLEVPRVTGQGAEQK